MNDFGGYLGGPVSVPHFYNGHDKTFFFMSYEGLRLPRETPLTESVPSVALRNGDLSAYGWLPFSIRSRQVFRSRGTKFPKTGFLHFPPMP